MLRACAPWQLPARDRVWGVLPNMGLLEWVVSAQGFPTFRLRLFSHHLLLPPVPPITGVRSSLRWAGSLSTYPWPLPFVFLACFSPNLLHMSSVLVSASGRTHTYHYLLHIISVPLFMECFPFNWVTFKLNTYSLPFSKIYVKYVKLSLVCQFYFS